MLLVKTAKKFVVIGLSLGVMASSYAETITGAGASFPYPIYAKWASLYEKETGNKVNYQSIGSGGG
ncbi:extracellular solute-binding protein, partial [Xanthomonas citri pv. citri]|nr:extracellular solute-binding protein [Xanthomonas citri pv. citri]